MLAQLNPELCSVKSSVLASSIVDIVNALYNFPTAPTFTHKKRIEREVIKSQLIAFLLGYNTSVKYGNLTHAMNWIKFTVTSDIKTLIRFEDSEMLGQQNALLGLVNCTIS